MSTRDAQRLSAVQRVRDVLERRALGRMASGQRRLAQAEEHLQRGRRAYAQLEMGHIGSAEQLRAARMAGLGAHEAVQTAASDVDVAAHRLGELEAEWSRTSVQRKSVERLVDSRAVEASAAAERAASRALDELVAQRRHRR